MVDDILTSRVDATALFERTPAALCLVDEDARILQSNPAWRELLSTNEGSVDLLQLFPEVESAWSSLASTGFTLEVDAAPPGTEDDTRTLLLAINRVTSVPGVAAICQATDVSSLKLAQAIAHAMMHTAVDAIITIDETGIIESFNDAAERLFGYAAHEVVGGKVNRLMPEPHRTDHEAYLARYRATGEKRIIGVGRELEAQRKDGSRVPVYLAVSEFEVGGHRRFTGIIRDISVDIEAREQRERLAHAGRLGVMGEMTAGIAHEINQPLTAIAMYAQAASKLIERGMPDPEKLRSALDKLTEQSLRAGAVIERIQRFVRDQEGHKEIVDVNELIEDLIGLARADARLNDVGIHLDLDDGLPEIACDPVQIQQVGLNLVRNAIDAMMEIDCANGREIRVTSRVAASPSGDSVLVEVSDRGPGVDAAHQDVVFTPFHTTKTNGMGMGLSICRSIIRNHGGVLEFRNNPDHGATFYFTLPVRTDDE